MISGISGYTSYYNPYNYSSLLFSSGSQNSITSTDGSSLLNFQPYQPSAFDTAASQWDWMAQSYSPQLVLANYQNVAQQYGLPDIFNSETNSAQPWMADIQNSPSLSAQWQQDSIQSSLLQQVGLYQNSNNFLGANLNLFA